MASAAIVLFNITIMFIGSTFLPTLALPLIAIIANIITYRISQKALASELNMIYEFTLKGICLTSLILLYLSGNIFVIDNILSTDMLDKAPAIYKAPIALRFIFWSWTLLLPVIYIALGIRKKDIVLIRTGIILCTAAVFTYRTYFSVLSIEAAMIIGGAIMMILSYALIKTLRTAKRGFTFEPSAPPKGDLNVEDLITERLINRATQQ